MREDGLLRFLLTDQLGSTSLTTDGSGSKISELRFKPWGEQRSSWGTMLTKYRYTGQRLESFGLYFYQSRWYDPSIGRFAQADSIIPNAGDPTSYDRYAYTLNNPIRYSDKSGHDPTCILYLDDQCARWSDNRYTQTGDRVKLTHAGDSIPGSDKKVRYGGAYIQDLYNQFKNTCGWWNNNDCGPDSSFKLEDFLGMWILFESNSRPEIASIIATIIAQNLFVGGDNASTCSVNGICNNAVFNLIAANIDGFSGIISGPKNLANQRYTIYNPGLGSPKDIRDRIRNLGSKALDPKSVVRWDRYNGPSGWGNYKYWGDNLRNGKIPEGVINGTDQNTVYFYTGNAVYYTVNQYNQWALNTNMEQQEPGVR